MIGLASAGCSRAVRRRPNAALVAESKRSGSSSSGGAVASGMSSVTGAGVVVFLGCRRSCNRTSALVFIVASVDGLVGTGAGAPLPGKGTESDTMPQGLLLGGSHPV